MLGRFRLPIIHRVVLSRFSLFTRRQDIEVRIPPGVFCLAGANGLGKSTFLMALIYGITGIVPEPGRRFESVDEYYRYCQGFASRFFAGRVREADRGGASVLLEMSIGTHRYTIERGVFEPRRLRRFELCDLATGPVASSQDFSHLSPAERHERYLEAATKHAGLEDFSQLAFLLSYLVTFDERRELLFWNSAVLERVLYLAFGVSVDRAKQADELQKEIASASSRARNANWVATQVRRQIRSLSQHLPEGGESPSPVLEARHKELLTQRDRLRGDIERVDAQIKDVDLQLASLSSLQTSLKSEYERLFSSYIGVGTGLEQHPLVATSVRTGVCGLCGATSEGLSEAIKRQTSRAACPLCGSTITRIAAEEKGAILASLRSVDAELGKILARIDEAKTQRERLGQEGLVARHHLDAVEHDIAQFEKENSAFLSQLAFDASQQPLQAALQAYHKQLDDQLSKRRREYELRDRKTRELITVQDELAIYYNQAQTAFVPRFRSLAVLFTGLSLDIRMETKTGASAGVTLLLDVEGSPRREAFHLSESQRLFVDIALRMALVEYMTGADSPAALLIDTPEGSLDVAYESRAGEMLARFVQANNNIVMTANINTSQLLKRLAERCGTERMTLHRMTEWSRLSEVQLAEERLFTAAYQEIERCLAGGGA